MPPKRRFHIYDTVKHKKYGIGTIIGFEPGWIRVDFDNWNEDFYYRNRNDCICYPNDLTLVQAYVPN